MLRALPYAGVVAAVLVVGPLGDRWLDAYSLPKELVLHLGAVAAVTVLWGRRGPIRAGRIEGTLGVGLALGGLSALLASNPWASLRPLALVMTGAALLCVARNLRADERRHLLIAVAVAVAATATLVVADSLGLIAWSMRGRAPAGLSGNRNFAAHLAAIGLPVIGYLLLTARRRGAIVAWAAVVTLASAAVVLTRSRATWLACIVVALIAVMVALAWRRQLIAMRGRAIGLGSAVVAGVALALLLPTALVWKTDAPYLDTMRSLGDYRHGTGRGRVVQYRNTLELIARNPALGVGPGNWSAAYLQVADPRDPNVRRTSLQPVNRLPNSDWLGLAAEWGLPAALCLLGAGALLLTTAWRRGPPGDAVTATAVAASVLVIGSLDSALQRPEPLLCTALALGALIPLGDGRSLPRLAMVVVVVLLGLAALNAGRLYAAHLLATDGRDDLARRLDPGDVRLTCEAALRAQRRGDCEHALPLAERALSLHPRLPPCVAVLRACERDGR